MKIHLATILLICFSFKLPIADNTFPKDVLEKGLFESNEMLEITLKGNIRELLNDRYEKPQYHPITLLYQEEDSAEVSLSVQMRTRGHFRKLKENCTYPPLFIDFPETNTTGSPIFKGQSKLKLVMPCKDDKYVVREWLAYKIYNLVTAQSFKVRLVKVKLEDVKNTKTINPFFGLLLEEEKQMAARNKMVISEDNLRPHQTDHEAFLRMAVFQYLIGNTDWSIEYLQNIKLIKKDALSLPIPVPYDFDHSGLVNAPYALPAEELLMRSVTERRYRGYCMNSLNLFEPTIALYNKFRNDIYDLCNSCSYLDSRSLKEITKFLDGFYEKINDPKAWQKDFAYPCDKSGTGHIVIKGLKED